MTRVAWFNCFAGVAGDMALGALIDAGASVDQIRVALDTLELGGWQLSAEHTSRNGLSATRAVVDVDEQGARRTYADISTILDKAQLPARARRRAAEVFDRLAEAEAAIHGVPKQDVHFHELGGVDTIVDIVGTCVALSLLDIDEVRSSAIGVGTGTVRSEHGILPNPPPAVTRLLEGAPVVGNDIDAELTTPTGAALLSTLATEFGAMPSMTIGVTGFGAGSRDDSTIPNVTQVVIGDLTATPAWTTETTLLVETTVDDVTGEVLAHTISTMLDLGANDAWITPVTMKKGRPGHMISVLVDPLRHEDVVTGLMAETGTLGVRTRAVDRRVASRDTGKVNLDGIAVRVKAGPYGAKAEHEDLVAAAAVLGLPIRELARRAEQLWRDSTD